MNWIDVLILSSVALAVYSGFRRGAITQLFGWGGFLIGLLIGAAVSPLIVKAFEPQTQGGKIGITLGSFLGIAFLVEGLLAAVGFKVRRKVTNRGAKHADAAIGALVAAFFSLATAWFLGYQLADGPSQELSRSIKSSKILQWTDDVAPRPPGFLAAISNFLDRTGFPDVFADLGPNFAPGVAPPPASLAKEPRILEAAEATYKIEGEGAVRNCRGSLIDGSGFPLDRSTVLTAAHVVAGTRNTKVIEPDGDRHPATVVYFDPDKDIAVLHVTGLPSRILDLDRQDARRGVDGAAIGYPARKPYNGRRAVLPARVRALTSAYGRDIYGTKYVTREVYVLSSQVSQGNSGGPFVDTDGEVRGLVFAASSADSSEAYALSGDEISRAYNAGRTRTRAVSTGDRCAV